MDQFGLSWEQIRSGVLRVTNSLIINKIADILETAGFYLVSQTDGVSVAEDEDFPNSQNSPGNPKHRFIWWPVRGEQEHGDQKGEQDQNGMEAVFGQIIISALLGIVLLLSLYAFFAISRKLVGHLMTIYTIVHNGYIYIKENKERNRRVDSKTFDAEVYQQMVAKEEKEIKREVKEETNGSLRSNSPTNEKLRNSYYRNLNEEIQYLSDPITITGYVEQQPEVEVEAPPIRRRYTPYNPFSPNQTPPDINPWMSGHPPRAESSQPYVQVSRAPPQIPVRQPGIYQSMPPPIPPRNSAPNHTYPAPQSNHIPPNAGRILSEDEQLRHELQEMRAQLRQEILNRQRLEGELRNNDQMRDNRSMSHNFNSSEPERDIIDPINNINRQQNPINPNINIGSNANPSQAVNASSTITLPREAFDLINNLSRATANTRQSNAVKEKIEIPKFNGDIDEAYEWHREFVRITESKRWTNEDRMKNIPNYLIDSAKVWFNGIYHSRMTWEEFLPLFFELYIPEDTIYRFEREYNTAKQRANETAVQYLYRVIELGKRINDDINIGQIKMIMKKGLKLELARYAISSRNYTLAEMVELLKGYDSVDMESNRRRDFNNRIPFTNNNNNNQRNVNNIPNQQTVANNIPQNTSQFPTQQSFQRSMTTPAQQALVNNNISSSKIPQQNRAEV